MQRTEATPYRASGPLILSGGLKTKAEAKCYHGLLVLAQMAGWKPDERGEYRVRVGDLHRLTNGTHRRWKDYVDTLSKIRDEVRLDWGHLSRQLRAFNRYGTTTILSEVRADLDLAGEAEEIVFTLPRALIEDVVKPHWFGQVDPAILFSLRSNYAFHAYLFACLTVVKKDNKTEHWSQAFTLDEWREILAVPAGSYDEPSKFRAFVFRRTEASIAKATRKTGHPLEISWKKTPRGLYQMRVQELPSKALQAPSGGPESARNVWAELSTDQKAELWNWLRGMAKFEHLPESPAWELIDGNELHHVTGIWLEDSRQQML